MVRLGPGFNFVFSTLPYFFFNETGTRSCPFSWHCTEKKSILTPSRIGGIYCRLREGVEAGDSPKSMDDDPAGGGGGGAGTGAGTRRRRRFLSRCARFAIEVENSRSGLSPEKAWEVWSRVPAIKTVGLLDSLPKYTSKRFGKPLF
jgi:hypothetical protein